MSSEQDKIRMLAERIAGRLAQKSAERSGATTNMPIESVNRELAALRDKMSEMQRQLAQIESHTTRTDGRETSGRAASLHADVERASGQPDSLTSARASAPFQWSSTYVPVVPPSEERFGIGEAVAELVDHFESGKTCNVEPGNKPCDHCSMCSSRGF